MHDETLQQTDCQLAQAGRAEPAGLPGYRLETLLGTGAFGAVWAGVQERTGLRVAVKLLHGQWDAFRGELERLRALAEHPNILTLLDADLDHSPPFLVTPLLSGGSLDRASASLERRVQWISQLAEALEFTHRKGLLHCDVKPSNVLLDEEGRARLADFGQSVACGASRGSLGTLGYMAPEQTVGGQPHPAWDIYGLGATAFFLLTGAAPRLTDEDRAGLSAASGTQERLRLYRECLAGRELAPFPAEVDAELASIVARCLSVDPQARYQDGAQLLADLQRRETRALREALAAARREARRATAQLLVAQARGVERDLALLLAAASLELGGAGGQAETLIRELADELDTFEAGTATSPVSQLAWSPDSTRLVATTLNGHVRLWHRGSLEREFTDRLYSVVRSLALSDARLVLPATDRSLHVRDLATGEVRILTGHTAPIYGCALAPDGDRLASGAEDRTIRLWRLAQPEAETLVLRGHAGTVRALAFSPDGQWLASAGSTVVRLWDHGGAPCQVLNAHPETVLCLAFSPDGRLLVSGSDDATARVWRFRDGRLLPNPLVLRGHEGAVLSLRFAPDGQSLATVSADRSVRLWNLRAPEPPVILRDRAGAIRAVAWASHLACGCEDGRVRRVARDSRRLVEQARRAAGRDFTPQEVERFALSAWAEQLPETAVGSAAALHERARELLEHQPERAESFVVRALLCASEQSEYLATLVRTRRSLEGVPAPLLPQVLRIVALTPEVDPELLARLQPEADPGAGLLMLARLGRSQEMATDVRGLGTDSLRQLLDEILEALPVPGLEALGLLALDSLLARDPHDALARAQLSRLYAPLYRRVQDGVEEGLEELLQLDYQDQTVPARLRLALP